MYNVFTHGLKSDQCLIVTLQYNHTQKTCRTGPEPAQHRNDAVPNRPRASTARLLGEEKIENNYVHRYNNTILYMLTMLNI